MNVYKVTCIDKDKVVSTFYTEYIWLALVDFTLKNRIFFLKRAGEVFIKINQENNGDIEGSYCNMIGNISCSKTGEVINIVELKTLTVNSKIESGFTSTTEHKYKGKSYTKLIEHFFNKLASMSGENVGIAKILSVIAIKDKNSPFWKENKASKQKLELG